MSPPFIEGKLFTLNRCGDPLIKKLRNHICGDCGSTDINIIELESDYSFKTSYSFQCNTCKSKRIGRAPLKCDWCGEKLIFDEDHYEILCDICGYVHAGTDSTANYSLGFLLKRPNFI